MPKANIYLAVLYSLGLIYIITACSCNTNKGKGSNQSNKRKIVTKDSTLNSYIKVRDKMISEDLELRAGIARIGDKSNNILLRIYKHSTWLDNEVVFTIENKTSNWSAKLVQYSVQISPMQDSVGITINRIAEKAPNILWKDVIDSLEHLGIFELPDASVLKGYDVPSDGTSVEIEYVVNADYRKYSYSNPEYNTVKFIEAKRLLAILKFIQATFGIKGFASDEKVLE